MIKGSEDAMVVSVREIRATGVFIMADPIYHCRECNKRATVKEGDAMPICCGLPMEPLPYCPAAISDPEQARNYRDDEPCDDGTLPKKG